VGFLVWLSLTLLPRAAVPAVELNQLTTHEHYRLRPNTVGHFGKKELHGWSRFLRCHHTQRVHSMHPRLAVLLYSVGRHFAGHKLLVVAGYRAPKVAKEKGNSKSPHKAGLACDFRVDGIPTTTVRDFIRQSFHKVGIGYYPNSDFVHLDVGRKRDAFWIDYSGPGERARYSNDPDTDLAGERPTPAPAEAPPPDGGAEPQGVAKPGVDAPNQPPALIPNN
jgi:uncharacterized protein YcbK (DUF882 family)